MVPSERLVQTSVINPLEFVHTGDGSDGSGVVCGVGIGRRF